MMAKPVKTVELHYPMIQFLTIDHSSQLISAQEFSSCYEKVVNQHTYIVYQYLRNPLSVVKACVEGNNGLTGKESLDWKQVFPTFAVSLNHHLNNTYTRRKMKSFVIDFRPEPILREPFKYLHTHKNSLNLCICHHTFTLHPFFRTMGLVFKKLVSSISLSPCTLMVRPSCASQAREL